MTSFDRSMFAGITKLAELICWSVNVVYGFLASDDGLIVPDSTSTKTLFRMYANMFTALRKNNYSLLIKDRGIRYRMPLELLVELANMALPCVFNTEKLSQLDGDYVKHLLHHSRFILL